jgi:hypothetical protein
MKIGQREGKPLVKALFSCIKTAQQVVSGFGMATECGLGRRPTETIAEVLQIHAAIAAPVR